MKRLFVFILVFNIHSIYAQYVESRDLPTKECADCSSKKIDDERLSNFIKSLCREPLTLRDSVAKKAGEYMERKLLIFLGISKDDENYKTIITNFWNKYSHLFICTEEYGATKYTRSPQHLLKRIIDLGMHKTIFYKFLLSDPEGYPIDVNTIEVYNGKKETVLDYIDNILESDNPGPQYNVKEIRSLRGWLVKAYNAKKAEDIK